MRPPGTRDYDSLSSSPAQLVMAARRASAGA